MIPGDFSRPGYNFITPQETAFQIGVNSYPQGGRAEAHKHNPVERSIIGTMEFIVVRKGKMRVDLFDELDRRMETIEMAAGDSILLIAGGHGMTFSEDCQLLEVKQGPFVSRTLDKTILAEESTEGTL
ncbi:MAG: hypothetical protein P4L87_23690 [Formivibrio sp.]|nr:hypothetical protein [Formivibrio sp.]